MACNAANAYVQPDMPLHGLHSSIVELWEKPFSVATPIEFPADTCSHHSFITALDWFLYVDTAWILSAGHLVVLHVVLSLYFVSLHFCTLFLLA